MIPPAQTPLPIEHPQSPQRASGTTLHALLLVGAAVFFIAAGLNHFRSPEFYKRIVPPQLPWPGTLVAISGIAEIAGGAGLMVRKLRRWASWGLIALLIAVFPANIYMALSPGQFADLGLPQWALWVRLPIQAVVLAWVWWVGLRRPRQL